MICLNTETPVPPRELYSWTRNRSVKRRRFVSQQLFRKRLQPSCRGATRSRSLPEWAWQLSGGRERQRTLMAKMTRNKIHGGLGCVCGIALALSCPCTRAPPRFPAIRTSASLLRRNIQKNRKITSQGIREEPQGNKKWRALKSLPQPRSGSALPPDASLERVCVWRMRYCPCNSNNHVNATIKPVTPETRGNGKEHRVAGAVPSPGRPARPPSWHPGQESRGTRAESSGRGRRKEGKLQQINAMIKDGNKLLR